MISRFFFIYFTITGVTDENRYIEVSLYFISGHPQMGDKQQ